MRFLFILLSLIAWSASATGEESTLCSSSEKALFSCQAKAKIISVCSSNISTPENAIVIYRYGVRDKEPELEYSSEAGNFDDYFQYAHDSYPKGSIQELSFNVGKYVYTVHQDSHVYRPKSAGVFVEKDSKELAYIECNTPSLTTDLYPLHKLTSNIHPVRNIGTLGP